MACPRARRWDTVATAEAPALKGDTVHFVSLADGTLVVDEDEPDGALASLADAVEQAIPPPYRAEAVRRERRTRGRSPRRGSRSPQIPGPRPGTRPSSP